ncbi:hypothetical protein [Gimesia sp.]|uniref:hypothetical protein n=1 Tax=Gimesia sp. TaxID=2024833 RepID=UPI003A9318E2
MSDQDSTNQIRSNFIASYDASINALNQQPDIFMYGSSSHLVAVLRSISADLLKEKFTYDKEAVSLTQYLDKRFPHIKVEEIIQEHLQGDGDWETVQYKALTKTLELAQQYLTKAPEELSTLDQIEILPSLARELDKLYEIQNDLRVTEVKSPEDPLYKVLENSFGHPPHTIGEWMLLDWLDHWCVEPGTLTGKPVGTSETFVLADTGQDGRVFKLSIELFEVPAPGAIVPNLLLNGLMRFPEEENKSPILKSIQNMWQLTGLENRYRARWGMEILGGAPCSRDFCGRSPEAAFLIGLLSAAGHLHPAHDGTTAEDWKLHSGIAASATINTTDEKSGQWLSTKNNPEAFLENLQLGPVRGIVNKKQAAEQVQIHYIAVEKESLDDLEIDEKEAGQDKFESALNIGYLVCQNAGTLFQMMLERKSFQRQYAEQVKMKWLEQWEPGTAEYQIPVAIVEENEEPPGDTDHQP